MSFRAKAFFTDSKILELCKAVSRGDESKIKTLVSQGVDLTHSGRDGVYPLLWALLAKKMKGYRLLLESGASPNQLTIEGDSVMSIAAQHPKIDYLKLAVKHGGDINIRDSYKATPLMLSVRKLHEGHLKFLLSQKNVKVEAQDSAGWTALMHATSKNRPSFVKILLDASADPDQASLAGLTARKIAENTAGAEVKALFAQ
jgi:ankyrin repeat protein